MVATSEFAMRSSVIYESNLVQFLNSRLQAFLNFKVHMARNIKFGRLERIGL